LDTHDHPMACAIWPALWRDTDYFWIKNRDCLRRRLSLNLHYRRPNRLRVNSAIAARMSGRVPFFPVRH